MNEVFMMPPAPPRALWVIGAVILLLLAILVLLGSFVLSSRVTRYRITPGGLAIERTVYGRTIPWSSIDLEQVRVVDLQDSTEFQPGLRTNGIGLPGYQSGWFRLRRAGRGLLFLTDRSQVVVVPTSEGYTVLLSVDRPAELVDALRRAAPA